MLADRGFDIAPDRPVRNLDGDARIFRANSIVRAATSWSAPTGRFRPRRGSRRRDQLPEAKTLEHRRRIEYDFGPGALLDHQLLARQAQSRGDIDGGFGCTEVGACPTPARLHPLLRRKPDNVLSLDQFTQEVRIASNNRSWLGYQAGVFYFDEDLDIESLDFAPSPPIPAPAFGDDLPNLSAVVAAPGRQGGHLRVGQLQVRTA